MQPGMISITLASIRSRQKLSRRWSPLVLGGNGPWSSSRIKVWKHHPDFQMVCAQDPPPGAQRNNV